MNHLTAETERRGEDNDNPLRLSASAVKSRVLDAG